MNPRRGIVLLPAVAGINEYMLGVARRLQDNGWQTEIVDYFDGGPPPDLSSPVKIAAAVASVSDPLVLSLIGRAVTALKERGANNVGALGFCIGGGYALLAGAQVDGLSAVANYYGGLRYTQVSTHKPAMPIEQIGALRVPMIAHYGRADRFVPAADVDSLETGLDEAGKTFELFRYAGAPHAFDEDFRPAYRPVAAREAWARTLTFLDWYVRPD